MKYCAQCRNGLTMNLSHPGIVQYADGYRKEGGRFSQDACTQKGKSKIGVQLASHLDNRHAGPSSYPLFPKYPSRDLIKPSGPSSGTSIPACTHLHQSLSRAQRPLRGRRIQALSVPVHVIPAVVPRRRQTSPNGRIGFPERTFASNTPRRAPCRVRRVNSRGTRSRRCVSALRSEAGLT
jgi:hypothetical protein